MQKKNNKIVQKCAKLCTKLRANPNKIAQLEKLSPSFYICDLKARLSGETD